MDVLERRSWEPKIRASSVRGRDRQSLRTRNAKSLVRSFSAEESRFIPSLVRRFYPLIFNLERDDPHIENVTNCRGQRSDCRGKNRLASNLCNLTSNLFNLFSSRRSSHRAAKY